MKSHFACLNTYLIVISFFLISSIPATAQLQPITINGLSFNQDLIAEGAGSDPTLLTSTDIGGNFIFYDESFNTSHPIITAGGLPASGLITNSGDTWQLRPYTNNNSLFFIPQLIASTRTLILTTPAKYSQISLLGTSVAGPVTFNITLNFTDATSTAFPGLSLDDWIGNTPFVISGIGAITRTGTVTAQQGTPDDPRLYQIDLEINPVDQLKDVTSISITNTNTSNIATAAFFAVSGISTATLPITFSSLKGEYQSSENKIVVTWQAEAGLSSPGFDVERSADGMRFTSLATVPPQKNIGISTYSYSDIDLQNRQAWFYRIKETVGGGIINYSRIINVKTSAVASFKIIRSGAYIRLAATQPEKSYRYKITDLHGRELKSGTAASTNQYSIDIRSLPSGPYVLNFQDQTQTRSLRFVK